MNQYRLIFEKPRRTAIERRTVPQPEENELLVANRLSAISAGTEMLIFGGHFPEQMAVDTKIASLSGAFRYPLAYGYSSVGEVIAAGNPDNAGGSADACSPFIPMPATSQPPLSPCCHCPTISPSMTPFFWPTWRRP
jgi:hypothetical protein